MSPIPEGQLYNDGFLSAGKIAEHHPATHVITRSAEEAVKFGRGVVMGDSDGGAKLPDSASGVFLGIAGWSSEASDIENEEYSQYDPMAIVESGIVMAYVEEAVSPEDPVRIRHAQEAGTKGSQSIGFSAAKTGSSATGLADDADAAEVTGDVDLSSGHDWSTTNAKSFIIEVNGGVPKQITLDAECANLTAVLAELNAEFTEAGIDDDVEAVASGNFVKLQTKAAGADQSIEVSEGSGALAQLGIDEGAYAGSDGTEYAASVAVNGVAQSVSVAGYKAQTIAELIAEINADLTGATASFIDATDEIKIESNTVGDLSSIAVTDVTLFAALTNINAAFEAAVPGSGDPDTDVAPGNFCTNASAGKTALVNGARFEGSTTGAGVVPVKITGTFSLTADV